MQVKIDNQTAHLSDEDELGAGGEARVFEWQGQAVKVFHDPEDAFRDKEKRQRESRLRRKAHKVRDFPDGTPPQVIAPEKVVYDSDGQFCGYTMRMVQGHDLRMLSKRSWREQYGVDNGDVQKVFDAIYEVFEGLHGAGIVVGDFNDTNALFRRATMAPILIDTDSYQFDSYPCTVAHQRYLDPRLYGEDLSGGPLFTDESDWYSYAVLLFESLLYVHPYGGTHSDYPTLLRRAEGQHSVFNDDVRYPSSGTDWRVLPDQSIAWFRMIFDRGEREKPPRGIVEVDWSECSTCGREHGHRACPICSTQETPVPSVQLVSGGLELEPLFDTGGTIVHADGQQCVYWSEGTYYRENGDTIINGELSPEFRFRTTGRSTWMGKGEKLIKINRGEVVDKRKCDTFQNTPCFDTTDRHVYYLDEGWLFDNNTRRVGKRVKNRTILWCGDDYGILCSMVGQATQWTAFYPGLIGMSDLDLPSLKGKLLEARVTFSGTFAMVSVVEEYRGKRRGFLSILDDGEVLGTISGASDQHRCLGEVRSMTLRESSGLIMSEEGLVSVKQDFAGSLREAKVFEDARDLITPGCRLFPGEADNELIVTGSQKIYKLSI